MVINLNVQYSDGFLTNILLLTQAPVVVWFGDDSIFVYYYYPFNYVLHCLLFCFVWWSCMAINASVLYNDGFLPAIVLLTPKLLPSGNPFKCHE